MLLGCPIPASFAGMGFKPNHPGNTSPSGAPVHIIFKALVITSAVTPRWWGNLDDVIPTEERSDEWRDLQL